MRKALRLRPGQLVALGERQRRDDVQALSAGRLAEADKPEIIEAVAHFSCGFNDGRERDVGAGIKIKDEAARYLRLLRLAIPGMQFESADLCDSGKAFNTVDL